MFVLDISSSMAKRRIVDLPPGPGGEKRSTEMSNLEWALRFVKTKTQEMVSAYLVLQNSSQLSADLQWQKDREMWRHYLWL